MQTDRLNGICLIMELERIVLISDAIARSKAEAERQRSAEQARESIPEFRRRLSGLILANVVQKNRNNRMEGAVAK